ncbi:C40 family peptidase [Amnibacterium setariae]|uniref:NlpC/P60 family protein n=1 Tax=Amnibacterium setariae TaxID=2306585 RepID=A0A3A1U4C0_9MICO|nr:C40 family peptidase [Amnibacterium setariae]RIX30287.1 NlpC/P60 family protein [Amnibacterium setariae]
MSYADVVNQMQAIQTQLAQLGFLQAPAATSGASASSFASALQDASATPAVSASSSASSTGGLVSPNGVTGDAVVDAALDYKGVPYVLGGESKSGIDCSGLVQAAFAKVGVTMPRTVHEQKVLGQPIDSLKDAKPGDLIVLNGGDHIAVWMGNDTVIHAPYPGRSVSVQKAWFDDADVVTIRRIVPATGDASAGVVGSTGSTAAPSLDALTGLSATGSSSGLSQAASLKAAAMLSTYGADVGLYDPSGGSGSTSLSGLLGSFGLSGTGGGTGANSAAAQQIAAARAALLGSSAA